MAAALAWLFKKRYPGPGGDESVFHHPRVSGSFGGPCSEGLGMSCAVAQKADDALDPREPIGHGHGHGQDATALLGRKPTGHARHRLARCVTRLGAAGVT